MPVMPSNAQPDPSSSSSSQLGTGAVPLTHNDPSTGDKVVNMDALLRQKQTTQDKYKHTQANIERNEAKEKEKNHQGKGHTEL